MFARWEISLLFSQGSKPQNFTDTILGFDNSEIGHFVYHH